MFTIRSDKIRMKGEPAKFRVEQPSTKYERLRAFLSERHVEEYRFAQITHAIFRERTGEFERMTALPKALRSELKAAFGESILSIRPAHASSSEQATKLLFELADGNRIEAVGMRYRAGWQSYCISSQSGCHFGCTFCATGAIGLKRSLTADEISDQVLYFHLRGKPLIPSNNDPADLAFGSVARKGVGQAIDSISFMGMGEALANPYTFPALRALTDSTLFGLSPRRITVSTIGVIPAIKRMTREFPQVNLTFSLHSPFHEQRSLLVPFNRTYALHEVMMAMDEHIQSTGRKVYIAYTLLRGVNDTPEHAQALIALLKGRGAWDHLYHVNLIRYNPAIGAPGNYDSSDQYTLNGFYQQLRAGGVHVTTRQSFGVEIDAACGQLYGRYQAKGTSL